VESNVSYWDALKILGLEETPYPTKEQIVNAYRARVKYLHPDRASTEEERRLFHEQFVRLQEARRILESGERHRPLNSANRTVPFDETATVHTEIELTLKEAVVGCTKDLEVTQTVPCPSCLVAPSSVCHQCDGRHFIEEMDVVRVMVPPLSRHGDEIVVDVGARLMVLTVTLRERDRKRVEGDSLHDVIAISCWRAIMGGGTEYEHPTKGTIRVHVKPGTSSNTIIKVKGYGAYPGGDLFLRVIIQCPSAESLEPEDLRFVARMLEAEQ